MRRERQANEPPSAIAEMGWRYHHLGIPTTVPRPGEVHLPHLKIHVSGFETSPFGIEWMRFEPGCGISELVRTVPHIAFEVDDLEAALARLGVTAEITSPSEGVRVAMIVDNGAPVELIEFRKPDDRQR
jgi:catechol 2,3-dioxygenase-like lactoylglutathione lyase family enzyme